IASSEPQWQSRSELNAYVGRGWAIDADWTASIHYARYAYPDDRPQIEYYYDDYDELQASVSFQDRVSLSLAMAPDAGGDSPCPPVRGEGTQWSDEASLRQPLWRKVALVGGLGYYDLKDLFRDSYWGWSAGAELGLDPVRITITRFDVDNAARRLFGNQ